MLGVSSSQTLGYSVTKNLDQPARPPTNVMWRTRRFAAPLRETYPIDANSPDDQSAEQFIQLLEQAERRLSSKRQGS
jgi:hypothetical protein